MSEPEGKFVRVGTIEEQDRADLEAVMTCIEDLATRATTVNQVMQYSIAQANLQQILDGEPSGVQ